MRRPLAALCAALAVVAAAAASCDSTPEGVEVGQVRRATVTEVVDAPANVTARSVATLTAPADGTVAELRAAAGAQVRAGDVLAVVDSPSAQRRLADARTALAATRRGGVDVGGDSLADTQRRTDRAAAEAFAAARAAANRVADPAVRQALLAQIAAAERQYRAAADQARRIVTRVERGLEGLAAALSALTSAQQAQAAAAYQLAKATVDALTLRAPIAGVVQLGGPAAAGGNQLGDLLDQLPPDQIPGGTAAPAQPPADSGITVGSVVSAGTPVVTVVDVSELGLAAEVDETDILLVNAGGTASVELDAAPGARYPATVRSVDTLPTASGRGGVAYRVRLALGAGRTPDGGAAPVPKPGMSAVVHLEVRQAVDAVAVPVQAVFHADGRDVVWVVRDGKAVRQEVRVGVSGEDLVQVMSGVALGQRIVVRGADKVRAGQKLT